METIEITENFKLILRSNQVSLKLPFLEQMFLYSAGRQGGMQAGRQAERQAGGREAGRQVGRQRDRQTDRQVK